LHRDKRAFAELFTFFAPRLKGFGLRRGSSSAASEELVQETMLTVWRKAETFDPAKATVATWVFTIVRNKRIDMFRREGRPDVDLSEAEELPADDKPADEALFAEQAGRSIRAALLSLPKDQLEVVRKAFYEDKSHSAIAEELGLPLGTVKSRIRLGLARLKIALPETKE
jgi:RNA polymerase sigma-70 factor (ECF subfamily)